MQGWIHSLSIESTKKYILELREEHKVDMIIALTHSKLLNDRVLADKINGIDLVLSGGFYDDEIQTFYMSKHTRTLIVKSGVNLNHFTWIQFIAPSLDTKNNQNDIVDNQHSQS